MRILNHYGLNQVVGCQSIHRACAWGKRGDTADTIQYMLELDPELINAEDRRRYLPIHYATRNRGTKSIELLLKYDPDAASKKTNDGNQHLPLHLACMHSANLSSIQVLYDAYPEGNTGRQLDFAHLNWNEIPTNTACICPPGAGYDSHHYT